MLGTPSLLVGTGPLPPKALAALPPAASLPTGTQYEVTDYGGNVAIVVNGAWLFAFPFRTTWAALPPLNLVPVGTETSVTDVGGAIAVATASGWTFRPIEVYNSIASVVISGATSTAEQTAFLIPVPAGLLGAKGTFEVTSMLEASVASTNGKTIRMRLNGNILSQLVMGTSHKTYGMLGRFKNYGRASQKNQDGQIFTYGGSGGVMNTTAVDTTADTTVGISMQLGATTETLTFHGCTAVVRPAM